MQDNTETRLLYLFLCLYQYLRFCTAHLLYLSASMLYVTMRILCAPAGTSPGRLLHGCHSRRMALLLPLQNQGYFC